MYGSVSALLPPGLNVAVTNVCARGSAVCVCVRAAVCSGVPEHRQREDPQRDFACEIDTSFVRPHRRQRDLERAN